MSDVNKNIEKENEKKENGDIPGEKNTDRIQESIGDFGPWQLQICLLLSFVKIPVAWHQLGIVFLAAHTDFWCARPSSLGPISVEQWRNISKPPGQINECSIYNRNYLNPGDFNTQLHTCEHWEYDRSTFTETIITEWDLVCGRAHLADVAQMVFMFGVLIGNVVFGILADRYGRKMPVVISSAFQVIAGVGCAFAPWYELLLVLRFFDAVATGGQMITTFVICMEILGGKYRTTVSNLYHVPFSIGVVVEAGIAYLFRDWRHFQLAVSIPSVFLLAHYWFIPESPRWLIAVGRDEEAIKILEQGAKRNKLNPDEVAPKVHLHKLNMVKEEKRANILDLFRSPVLRVRTLCIYVNWTACGICFFGIHQYVGQIGNIFLNFAISGLIELPGALTAMYCMEKFGRKPTMFVTQMLAAVSCFLIIFALLVAPQSEWAKVILAFIGLLGMSMSFPTVYLYSGELFPTVVRNAGVGSSSMCARIGSMLAPFVVSLASVSPYLPPFFFGLVPFVGALLILLLPETVRCDLPDTLEEGENFGRKKKKIQAVDAEKFPNDEKATSAF